MVRAIAKDLIAKQIFCHYDGIFWICRWCSKWYKPYKQEKLLKPALDIITTGRIVLVKI